MVSPASWHVALRCGILTPRSEPAVPCGARPCGKLFYTVNLTC